MNSKLFERDWQFILDALYRINSSTTVDALEKETLECLMILTPCSQATAFIAAETEGRNSYARPYVVGEKAHFIDEFCTGKYDNDAYFRGFGVFPATKVFRDTDLMPDEYREGTQLYQNIYAKQNLHYALRAYLVHNQKIVGNISLFNSKERGNFSDRSVSILTQMAPHIALKLGELLEREGNAIAHLDAESEAIRKRFGLTLREQEVVRSLFTGETDRAIAEKLCISVSTLKKHIYNAYKKIGVNNRIQLYAAIRKELDRVKK